MRRYPCISSRLLSWVALLLAMLAPLSGCGGGDDTSDPDSGTAARDGGSDTRPDAHVTPEHDAGMRLDGFVPRSDGGVIPRDAGEPPPDAGASLPDAGTVLVDATLGSDAGIAAPDAYVVPPDAGPADLCEVTVCDAPPPATCTSASTLRQFAAMGTCAAGTCMYAPTDVRCDFGCESGACRTTGRAFTAYLKASNAEAQDVFGDAVAISGDGTLVAVGAPSEDSGARGVDGNQADNSVNLAGAVYLYRRQANGRWAQEAYVKAAHPSAGDAFGTMVALSADGRTLAVSAPNEDSAARGVGGDDTNEAATGSGAVFVFVRDAMGHWSQQAYIKASNAETSDWFGMALSLAADGNTLAVGAPFESSSATNVAGDEASNAAPQSGAVYVFRRSGAVWSQQAFVKASNTDAGDQFGRAVDLSASGNVLVVGAPREDSSGRGVGADQVSNAGANSGAAYVYRFEGSAWSYEQYFKASFTRPADEYGQAVALSDDGATLAVGAYGEDSMASGVDGDPMSSSVGQSGAVFLYRRSAGGVWSQRHYVKASNPGEFDQFGYTLDVSGDGHTFVVSALGEASNAAGFDGIQTNEAANDSGAVYVFHEGTAGFTQVAYVKAPTPGPGDRFGRVVAVSGDGTTFVATSYYEDSSARMVDGDATDNSATDSGAAYVARITY